MSARKSMDERIAEAVAAALAAYIAEHGAPVSGAQASGPARSRDGRDFACTADKPCSRMLRSATRAAIHGVDKGGHDPR